MDDFEKEIKAGFLEEAGQLQSEAEACFLALESDSGNPAHLEKIFRIAHNIKGSSKAVGFSDLGAFTHEFESFLLKLKNGEIAVTADAVTLLLAGNDHLRLYIEALRSDLNATLDGSGLVAKFKEFQSNAGGASAPAAAAPAPETEAPTAADIAALTDTHLAAEAAPATEAPAAPVMPAAMPTAPAAAAPPKAAATTDESIRVSVARLEKLVNLVGEVAILQTVLREQSLHIQNPLLRRTVHHLGKVSKEVQDVAMGLRMIPLKQTFQKMQRIVRDTSSQLGKKVNLVLEGEDTEVDKTVLESLGDPLVHMVRNAVDHGIESKEKRLEAGKPEEGTVILRAFHQSGRLVIEIKDDGGGIDPARLRKKAEEKGIMKDASKLTDREAIHLIFHAGFSTKTEVTDVSGRGVGMDVVKTNIEGLQGNVVVESEVGKGSRFRVSLPLTLAIIDGMIVSCNGERFVIPLSHVHESVRPAAADLHRTTAAGDMLLLRGENLPLYRLDKILGQRKPGNRSAEDSIAIIIRANDQPFATLVDDILGQHQVVIKEIGPELRGIRGVSGSAILGDGKPALILEVPELLMDRRAA